MNNKSNPVGWMVEISGADKFFYSEKSALNARKRYERDMDAESGPVPYALYKAAPQPAAHLTIPGALEWDGDNGTHGADGESSAHGESAYDDAREACAEIERTGTPGDVIREMNDELVDLRTELDDYKSKWLAKCEALKLLGIHARHAESLVKICRKKLDLDSAGKGFIEALDEFIGALGRDDNTRGESEVEPSAYTAVDMTTAAADGFRDGQTAATDSLKAFANELIGAAFEGGSFDGGDIQDIAVKNGLLQIEQRTEECGEVCACREYGFPAECYRKTDLLKPAEEPAAPAKCESCGGWGHIETEDSAHDCPECGPSVIERAVEDGVMNAPKPYAADDIPDFTPGSGNKAKRRIAAIEAAKAESFPCWSCSKPVTMEERAAADGDCPHCAAELDLEDWPIAKGAGGCAYEAGDWQCREGGYLWYAGDGEGYDPEDCTHICPHCRTKDYLEAAKEDAESCSSYSNNGSSGTGLDIWTDSEKAALTANHPAACKALAEIGLVSALDGDDVVICNTQQVGRDQAAKGGDQ